MMDVQSINDACIRSPDAMIVPFAWWHLKMMDLREADRSYFPRFEDYLAYMRRATPTHAYTGMYRGDMVMAFGLEPKWPGVAECWMMTARQIEGCATTFTRSSMRFFDHAATTLGLRRCQITVCPTNDHAMRWAAALRFEREGLMRGYAPTGADHWMMSRMF